MFKHIILTRFNLRSPECSDYQNSGVTDEWMNHRMDLFERYYLSSLGAQTCKDFYVFVFFDGATKTKYKDKITELQKNNSFFKPIYLGPKSDFLDVINMEIKKIVDSDTQYIITSRIDNDDAYHFRAIEYIQANFLPEDRYAINLTKGYRLVHGENKVLLKNSFTNGPFLSLIEKYDPGSKITTVHCHVHHEFFLKYKIKQIKKEYLWLQNIHGFNVSNDVCGFPLFSVDKLGRFGIKNNNIRLSFIKSFLQAFYYIFDIKNYVPLKLKYKIIEFKSRFVSE
jgi:hypothetical protein